MNKDLIKKRFSKNLKTYNENAKVQKRMAEKLIQLCKKNNYKKILEIGCGTGFLTECICAKLKFEEAELDIFYFQSEDIVTLSNGEDTGDGDFWGDEFGLNL